MRAEGKALICFFRVGGEQCGGVFEEGAGEDFGGGIGVLKCDDALSVSGLEGGKHGIGGVQAQRMVELVEPAADGVADELEVADHSVLIKGVRFQDELHPAGMAVGKAAFVRMFRELVSILDFDGFADAEGHGVAGQRVDCPAGGLEFQDVRLEIFCYRSGRRDVRNSGVIMPLRDHAERFPGGLPERSRGLSASDPPGSMANCSAPWKGARKWGLDGSFWHPSGVLSA